MMRFGCIGSISRFDGSWISRGALWAIAVDENEQVYKVHISTRVEGFIFRSHLQEIGRTVDQDIAVIARPTVRLKHVDELKVSTDLSIRPSKIVNHWLTDSAFVLGWKASNL